MKIKGIQIKNFNKTKKVFERDNKSYLKTSERKIKTVDLHLKKNYYNLFKCIMKPEEVTSVRELLKARCPQHK